MLFVTLHYQRGIVFEWIIPKRRLNATSIEHLCAQLNRFQRRQVYSSLETAMTTLKHNRLHVHKAIGSNRNVLKRRKICESQVPEWTTLQRKLLCKAERAQLLGSDGEGLKLVTVYAHTPVATPTWQMEWCIVVEWLSNGDGPQWGTLCDRKRYFKPRSSIKIEGIVPHDQSLKKGKFWQEKPTT